jgi:hypothetical protein
MAKSNIAEFESGYISEDPYVRVLYQKTKDDKNLVVCKETKFGESKLYLILKVFDINEPKEAKQFCKDTIERMIDGKEDIFEGFR